MIRYTSDTRAHGAGDPPARSFHAAHLELESFIRELGYPPERVDEAISHFRRERGAMTAEDAALRLAEWVSTVRSFHEGTTHALSVDDARDVFVLSGAAMWHADTLFVEPATLSSPHRAALAGASSIVVPAERPLDMLPQDLAARRWRRRRVRVEPSVRRVSWVPSP